MIRCLFVVVVVVDNVLVQMWYAKKNFRHPQVSSSSWKAKKKEKCSKRLKEYSKQTQATTKKIVLG